VITIAGNGSTIKRDPGAPDFRVFAVDSSGNLILQRTTVSGGLIPSGLGGGIVSQGAVTLTNSTISNNSAGSAAGGGVWDGNGSGAGPLSVTNSTITGNRSSGVAGGIYSYGGGTITNSTISGNSTFNLGGGFFNFAQNAGQGPFTVTNSLISGNKGGRSAVQNVGNLTLTNATISGNTASLSSGGVYNGGSADATLTERDTAPMKDAGASRGKTGTREA
jgi:hypothetical protein